MALNNLKEPLLDMKNSVRFSSFETSVSIIQQAQWKIPGPIHWKEWDEGGAQNFIKTIPSRDKRKLAHKNRLRLLLIQYQDMSQLYQQQGLLKTATDHGWINTAFQFLIQNATGGSIAIESPQRLVDSFLFFLWQLESRPKADLMIGIITQTPRDDFPFFSLSMSKMKTTGHQEADWVCLLFAGPSLSRETLNHILVNEPFPFDYTAPLPADFMFIPFSITRWQVEQVARKIGELEREIVQQETSLKYSDDQGKHVEAALRDTLFWMRRRQFMLQRRCKFAQELVRSMARGFDNIEKTARVQAPGMYSSRLRDGVQEQELILGIIKQDIDNVMLRINTQQTVVRYSSIFSYVDHSLSWSNDEFNAQLDNQTSIRLAKSMEVTAQQGRRDSASMRTIAIVTLTFLPGTFIASVFSSTLFNFQAESGDQVVSKYLWVFFVLTVPLTFLTFALWTWWFRRSERRNKKRKERTVVTA